MHKLIVGDEQVYDNEGRWYDQGHYIDKSDRSAT